MSPLVTQAMETLTVTCNLSSLHSIDEDRIKIYLKTLYQHGEEIDSTEIRIFAESKGWQKEPLKKITKYAESISNGRRVVIKHKDHTQTGKQIIDHLENRIVEKNTI